MAISFEMNFIGSIGIDLSDTLKTAADGLNDFDLNSFPDIQGLLDPQINYNFNLSSLFKTF